MAGAWFFNIPFHGHINPTLPLIRELVRRGDEITYFSTRPYEEVIKATGAHFRGYDHAHSFEGSRHVSHIIHHGSLVAEACYLNMVRHTRYQGIVIRDHQALLIKHREHRTGRGYWVIPGGGIETGETEEDCIRRELKEETNLDVEVVRLLYDEPDHPNGIYTCRKTYLCRPLSGVPSPGFEPELEAQANYSITEVRWFDLRSESNWPAELCNDPFTYPQIARIRQALGY